MAHPQFEIYSGKDGQFYFRLTASNGQNILGSEGYKAKDSCTNGIESVKKNAADSSQFEKKESANGKYYFVLKATNGQVIGQSQMYESAAGCDSGIESVQKHAPVAGVEDNS